MLSAWGVTRLTKNVPKAGMDRGLFAVLLMLSGRKYKENRRRSICVRGAAGMIKEWRKVFAGADECECGRPRITGSGHG